jgi:hypothetical protein
MSGSSSWPPCCCVVFLQPRWPRDGARSVHSLFQTLSILTTTGLRSADFQLWNDQAKMVLLVLMFIGGCAGSAAGGPEGRAAVAHRALHAAVELRRTLHPRGVLPVKLGGRVVPDDVMRGVLVSLFATINAVKAQPELAKFQFRATNQWIAGTHSRSRIERSAAPAASTAHRRPRVRRRPPGRARRGRRGAHAGRVPAARHRRPASRRASATSPPPAASAHVEVESTVEGDIDLRGILGFSDEVRNGYQQMRVNFRIKGDAPPEKLRELVEQSRRARPCSTCSPTASRSRSTSSGCGRAGCQGANGFGRDFGADGAGGGVT